jgi:carboxylesterase
MLHDRKKALRTERLLGEGEREFRREGGTPCVIAFHGFGGSASELRPMLDVLAERGYAVDATLLPGHGTRPTELQSRTFDEWVDAGRARIHHALERHERFVLLGFSLGSLVAMKLAAERPAGLAGLVAMGNALTLRAPSSLLGLFDRFGLRMPDWYLRKPRHADLIDTSQMQKIVTYDRHPLRAALEVHRAGGRVRELARLIACPTLILHGRRDVVCHWKNAEWLAANIGSRHVKTRIFEQSAHVLCRDGEREHVAREVAEFLASLR